MSTYCGWIQPQRSTVLLLYVYKVLKNAVCLVVGILSVSDFLLHMVIHKNKLICVLMESEKRKDWIRVSSV